MAGIPKLRVPAPAKINLTLEVLGKHPDGFHEIRSVIQAVALCDVLDFRLSPEVIIKSGSPGWMASASLAGRAVNLLRQVTGGAKGVTIEVTKQIPMAAGLGGDSSDAAATLLALNDLWKLGLSKDRLLELAAQLGSDVPFFLYGGTALLTGRGEVVTPLPSLPHSWVVMVVPAVPRIPKKTAQLYAGLRQNHYTDGRITERLAAVLREGGEFMPSLLFNTFENVAFERFSGLEVYRSHLEKLGAPNIHLAGSGPVLFSLVNDGPQAEALSTRCRQQGMATYLAETC
ncbi:MAG: 4-(cytidine 5'-diphospho)-2-C-methyl-D-erythritol kinase [Chloroflexi bacterium]|nr:4-(cytidine 5'-diphospho)-2-C-methyl-D-erythritol kinase [Chloroflexota bacterium]